MSLFRYVDGISRASINARGGGEDLAVWEVNPRPELTKDEVRALREVIVTAEDERPIQAHLAANRRLFMPLLSGQQGRWVRPQVRLGDRFVADFMIADADSVGFHWQYVELESPRARMFKRNGELADKARHATHQIQEWRDYVDCNGDLARRPRSEGGLGLTEIRVRSWGLVLVGRSEGPAADPSRERRRLEEENRIRLRSYDWLLDQLGLPFRP